jgi:PAS domain S-box-containing protein
MMLQDITDHQNSREALRQNAKRLEILRRADQIILSGGSPEELTSTLLPYICQLASCRVANALAFDRDSGEATILGILIDNEFQFGKNGITFSLDGTWPLEDLAQGEMITSENISNFSSTLTLLGLSQAHGVRFVINLPMVANNELLGVLNLGFEDQLDLETNQRETINQMAGELAIGIQQVRLHQELQSYAAQLEQKVIQRTSDLQESKERLRIILEAAIFGMALLDNQGHIEVSNPALHRLTGYTESELNCLEFSSLFHLDDLQTNQELQSALTSSGIGVSQAELRYICKDGQARWSKLTVSRVEEAGEDSSWLAVAVMEDITEQKKLQESLARTERLTLVGRLGTSLAHEINNPLQAVIGCLGLAEETLETDSEARNYLEIAMQELERAAGIVTQLRDLGRDTGANTRELVNLNAFIEKILVLIRKRCQNQGVQVSWAPAGDLPPIYLTPEHMQQVLLNIVLNALDAMPSGGQLQISTIPTGQPDGASVSVADNGVGIPSDKLEQIFEPFYSSRSDGLGLGLFISKKIVAEHGGHIQVESEPGKGSTFTLWLPYNSHES